MDTSTRTSADTTSTDALLCAGCGAPIVDGHGIFDDMDSRLVWHDPSCVEDWYYANLDVTD